MADWDAGTNEGGDDGERGDDGAPRSEKAPERITMTPGNRERSNPCGADRTPDAVRLHDMLGWILIHTCIRVQS
ncbi:hypothetical protein GCM10027093_64960 [Paraburkholderia jirisanensis]